MPSSNSLTHTKSLLTTILNASSPSLPGPTSHAILILFLAIAFSIASFATTLAAGVQILQRGDRIVCRALGSGIAQWVHGPVSYVSFGNNGYGLGGMERVGSVGGVLGGITFTIFASMIIPPLGTALFVGLLSLHFLPSTVSNRLGFLCGLILLVYISISAVFAAGMNIDIDDKKVFRDNICALTPPEASEFLAKKTVRRNLAGASYIFIGLQISCILTYLLLTLHAAFLNRKSALNADIRLQELRASPSTRSLPARLHGPSPALANTAHSVPRRAASEADVDVEVGTWGAVERGRWMAGGDVGIERLG